MSNLKKTIKVSAGSNIALVKYMGKREGMRQVPENPSVSMTLSGLRTDIEMRLLGDVLPGHSHKQPPKKLRWVWNQSSLSESARARAERFTESQVIASIHEIFGYELPGEASKRFGLSLEYPNFDGFVIEVSSRNTFPQGAGIASSASSFAAMTLAVFALAVAKFEQAHLKNQPELTQFLANLARLGSGSACRSFHGPFVAWDDQTIRKIESKLPPISDLVCLVSSKEKTVSSSEAHTRVKTSPLWNGRVDRASDRARACESAIQNGDFAELCKISWDEMWEMHSLFHTSQSPFAYWEPQSLELLKFLEPLVSTAQCLVTMDAGPNVHVLVPTATSRGIRDKISERFKGLEILQDEAAVNL